MISKKFLAIGIAMVLLIFAGCLKDDFVEIDGVCPVVISTDPTNGETNVPISQIILVNFNEEMDPTTITSTSLTLDGLTAVVGTITYAGNTATFIPSTALNPNTTYTGKVKTTVKDKKGNALQSDYVWTFSTGEILSPLVVSTDPVNLEQNVTLNKIITATFSMPMNAATINSSTFYISTNGVKIGGVVTFIGTTASFTPSEDLKSNTVYTGFISTNVKNTEGTSLVADYTWTFTTGSLKAPMVISTDPTNNAVNVPLDKVVSATFSEPMNNSTITNTTFIIRDGATIISGSLSYIGSTATFTPDVTFISGTLYTGRITTGVKNLLGVSLTDDYVWTFTTSTGIVPIIISTDPINNATEVPLNKTISATFNVNMDPTTINNNTFTLKNGTTLIDGTVTYSGTTASFNPTENLIAGVTYTAAITNAVRSQTGTPMQDTYMWTFSTGVVLAPTVISTDPSNDAVNVSLNKTITALFSVPMNPTTINNATFTLFRGTTPITGTVTYNGTTASFNPTNDLENGKVYTATITNGVKDVLGTPMTNNYVWTFSTIAAIPPTVIATDPVNNATNVDLNTMVTATFSVPMDPTTINTSTFMLFRGATQVNGTVSYAGTTATFNPSSNLVAGAIYTATITNSVKNTAGTSMTNNYVWTFSTIVASVPPTVISTDPFNNATNVALNKTITATFSVPMDPATINTNTFTLFRGNTQILGSVTYNGTTASFDPTFSLEAGAVYTATITNGVKNTIGTSMTNNYVWTFSTIAAISPTVISTDPLNNATNVDIDKTVTASFSVPMDPSTINSSSFKLQQNGSPVTGVITYNGTTASFNPSNNLLPSTTYTATITTGARSMTGVPIANDYVWSFTTKAPSGPQVVDLNSVAAYGIFAGVGISNNAGFSQITNMDVGITPGVRSSVTGFPPATVINGAIYASDDATPPGIAAILTEAKQDLTDAYLFAEGATTPAPVIVSGDIGGTTLAPGIYKTNSTLLIQSGDLTLDAQGNADAVWIFQIASGFTTIGGAGGNVILIGGAQAKNIFWQTGSSATIGDYTSFKGNILALTSVTMNSGASAVGRMLCINGAVVMTNTNFIIKP
ncbi:MAG TPA: Ig-like domain-containing protein [Saprospiraceae bacterium]|nr:Ig-like domain-containing protein [Saprospiraceae bacterium]